MTLDVFIGWDPREAAAFEVARHTILRHASVPVRVHALKRDALRAEGLYRREDDPLASTQFTYTRFLVPALMGFEGRALYFDCDFLWLADVADLLAEAPDEVSVACVQHDYAPTERTKMDGRPQSAYPRKNWSSLMLFDCGHEHARRLTPDYVAKASPAALHRFGWTDDDQLGALDASWNWLEGWYDAAELAPRAVHFTRGGPWFASWGDVDYADAWREAARAAGVDRGDTP